MSDSKQESEIEYEKVGDEYKKNKESDLFRKLIEAPSFLKAIGDVKNRRSNKAILFCHCLTKYFKNSYFNITL